VFAASQTGHTSRRRYLKYSVTGVVTRVLPVRRSYSYSVDLVNGKRYQISSDKIRLHPERRSLRKGAILGLEFDEINRFTIRVIKEHDQATVTGIDPEQRIASIQTKNCGRFRIRLLPEGIQRIRVGDMVDVDISYSDEGTQSLQLQLIHPRTNQERSSNKRGGTTTASSKKEPSGTQTSTPPPIQDTHPSQDRIEAETIGVDALMLERIKQENHRFEIVSFIEKHKNDGLIDWYDIKKGRLAQMGEPGQQLHPVIQSAIRTAIPEFRGFFHHQALALDVIRQKQNLVIVTQTASGKTLSYNPAIFEFLINNPQGHVLYIFPLNALMMDQLEKVNAMTQALQTQGLNFTAEQMVGHMVKEERDRIALLCPNIVVTNPEMLNFLLDRAGNEWRGFFSNLNLIVVDEVHSYRGLFGVHMTGIMRRLLITSRRLGSDPRFVISSATVNNPKDLAARLTSLPESEFTLLGPDQDGSMQADKHWLVLNPNWGVSSGRYDNYREVAAQVFVEMLLCKNRLGGNSPLNTILFCRSMRDVRAIKTLVDRQMDRLAPMLKNKVRAYISANLTMDTKREIYNGLRNGDLLGVISTNALEAGIDIGALDACIIAGFPFSVMTLRQMAGRVGRKQEGVVCFIPAPMSWLDQYYSYHPNLLLTQPPEEFVIDPQNPYIARKHINATACLGPIFDETLLKYWGPNAAAIAERAQDDRVMRRQGTTWVGTRRNFEDQDDVYNIGNIRSNVQIPYVVCRIGGECQFTTACFDQNKCECRNRITLMDQQYVYRDCHPGAVYEAPDQGLFRIKSVDNARRMVKAEALSENCPDRTYVEADVFIEFGDKARARKQIIQGVEVAWGGATVTRVFTGYNEYVLQPAMRCRTCKKEYDATITHCPKCKKPTEQFFNHSKPERKDFPAPYQQGFRIVLHTMACWLTIQPQIESLLNSCSACRLPGDQNLVLSWLKRPLDLDSLPPRLRLKDAERQLIVEYHNLASEQLMRMSPSSKDVILFPGIYDQCLLPALRKSTNESRALELFEALTDYPVTNNLHHICRDCQRSALFPAMHTVEHVVDARYPSVALGDRSDVGSLSTLGHPATGLPTIFWFDNYEGGLGAAEKIYELIQRLLESGFETLKTCSCSTLEGCPRCTYIPDCSSGNSDLSKPAGIQLISRLLGRETPVDFAPFLYSSQRSQDFDKSYRTNETATTEQGIGEEAPEPAPAMDPYQMLRIQRNVHLPVINKAFEVRSREITHETPPLRAEQLNQAYQAVIHGNFLSEWQNFPGVRPYEILEILPSASTRMIQQVYRTIALNVHPDANTDRIEWANEMMKQLNAAYEEIINERKD